MAFEFMMITVWLIVFAGIAFFLAIVLCICACRKRKQLGRVRVPPEPSSLQPSAPYYQEQLTASTYYTSPAAMSPATPYAAMTCANMAAAPCPAALQIDPSEPPPSYEQVIQQDARHYSARQHGGGGGRSKH